MDEKILEEKIQFILHSCKLYQDFGREMANADGLFSVKFFLVGLCNRAIALNTGFIDLTTSPYQNYLAALPEIRLMLDNAITGYAFFIAGDTLNERLKFIQHIREGKEPHSFINSKGKQLTERYVRREMNKELKGIHHLYSKGSSYIHYSKNLLDASVKESPIVDGQGKIQLNVNDVAGLYSDEERIEFWDDMIGANCYMGLVLVKWADYLKEVINPTCINIVERFLASNEKENPNNTP